MIRVVPALVFGVALLAGRPAQEDRSHMVVHVAVENVHGEPVRNLEATAFAISVDGQPRPVLAVTPASDPLSVVVMTDRSRSMGTDLHELDDALAEFSSALEAHDRVRAGSMSDEIAFAPAFTTDKRALRSSSGQTRIPRPRLLAAGSPLWDAIYESVALLSRERGRRAVVVFSDGRSTGNWHGLSETADFAITHAVAVSSVAVRAERGLRQNADVIVIMKPTVNLDRLAMYTGGVMVDEGGRPGALAAQFRTVANRLRGGYSLTFAVPSLDGRVHQLDVTVHAAVQVRAPRAFRAQTATR